MLITARSVRMASAPSRPHLAPYDQALEAGWPIATGVIEGACRHLIGDRLDITALLSELTSGLQAQADGHPGPASG